MNKLNLPPSPIGYAAAEGLGSGGSSDFFAPRANYKNEFVNNSAVFNVQWIVNRIQFTYLCKAYRYSEANGGEPFLIDLIFDNDYSEEYIAKFKPGSFSLTQIAGETYSVSAVIVGERVNRLPSMPDYPTLN